MSQSPATDAQAISTWFAEFNDHNMALAFNRSLEAHIARHMVRALVIWIILLLVFAPLKWLDFGNSREFIMLFTLRAGQCLLLAGIIAAALRVNTANQLAFALWEDMKNTNSTFEMDIERRKALESKLEKQALTSISPQDEGVQDIISRVGKTLYDGKRRGRNRVMTAEAT